MEFFRIRRDIPFMRHALVLNVISFITFALAVFFLTTRGLQLSIEFTGGTLVEVQYEQTGDIERTRSAVDGMGFGDNARVFLITRGLAEMMRLGTALGAERDTFMGLTGLGDLVLTCTDDQSRNRRFGLAVADGRAADEVIREIGQVVEGYHAARAVREVAVRHGVDMPISEHVYRVIYEGLPIERAVEALMTRAVSAE